MKERPPVPVIPGQPDPEKEIQRLMKLGAKKLATELLIEKTKAHSASSRVVHLEQQLAQAERERDEALRQIPKRRGWWW